MNSPGGKTLCLVQYLVMYDDIVSNGRVIDTAPQLILCKTDKEDRPEIATQVHQVCRDTTAGCRSQNFFYLI